MRFSKPLSVADPGLPKRGWAGHMYKLNIPVILGVKFEV
jgi:hypothetical protein